MAQDLILGFERVSEESTSKRSQKQVEEDSKHVIIFILHS